MNEIELPSNLNYFTKGGFPSGQMNSDLSGHAVFFVYSLPGDIFLFKIVKMNFANSPRKTLS